MDIIEEKVYELIHTKSDINEHLLTLVKYASQCESIIELGVRGCVSSWAFLNGLLYNNSSHKYFLMNDIQECDVKEIVELGTSLGVKMEYKWCNDLELNVQDSGVDMVFIDTWHIYGQLKRELSKFAPLTKKYILMHDTEIDGIYGEAVRYNADAEEQSKLSGIPADEIVRGLQPAIDEFLYENPQWKLEKQYTNNNGLTILKRF